MDLQFLDQQRSAKERARGGIFYSSSEMIAKTINPLFMDKIMALLDKDPEAGRAAVKALKIMDPACGNGNFLIYVYEALRDYGFSADQLYGIELDPHMAQSAREALPGARIVTSNALRLDWNEICQPDDNTFIIGNPPYIGDYRKSPGQKEDMALIFGNFPCRKLDYAASWFIKSARFLDNTRGAFSFIVTRSIACGVQGPKIFGLLFDMGYKIRFAYPLLPWDMPGAEVTVVIIGLDKNSGPAWRADPGSEDLKKVDNINANLAALPSIEIKERDLPLAPDLAPLLGGLNSASWGGLLLDNPNVMDPVARKYIRPYIGGREMIHNKPRYCFWLRDSSYSERANSPLIQEAMTRTAAARQKAHVNIPAHLFPRAYATLPTRPYLAVPRVSKRTRRYFVCDVLEADVLPNSSIFWAYDDDGLIFAVMESSMFMAWQQLNGGAQSQNIRFLNTMVYNTFPLRALSADKKAALCAAGEGIKKARAAHPGMCLADWYRPNEEPADILAAHEALDKVMDKIFAPGGVKDMTARQLALLKEYDKMQAPRRRTLFDLD